MALAACIPQGVPPQALKTHSIAQHSLWAVSWVLAILPVLKVATFSITGPTAIRGVSSYLSEEVRQQLVLKSCELKV